MKKLLAKFLIGIAVFLVALAVGIGCHESGFLLMLVIFTAFSAGLEWAVETLRNE